MFNDFLWKVPWPEALDAFGLTQSLYSQQHLPGSPELGALFSAGYQGSSWALLHPFTPSAVMQQWLVE